MSSLRIITFIAIIVLAFAAVGCTATDPGSSSGAPGDSTNPAESPEAAEAPIAPELIVEDLTVGNGAEAKRGSTAVVHYTGWLEDGTRFESSKDSGTPFEFAIGTGMVIAGWDQGVQGMQVGGVRRLTIPSELAYGPQGAGGGRIPPNATLVFEIELLEVR